MTQLITYIHNNAVHHGFVKRLTDWPYSSFHAYTSEESELIDKKCLYDWFGSKEQFIEFHKSIQLPVKLTLDE